MAGGCVVSLLTLTPCGPVTKVCHRGSGLKLVQVMFCCLKAPRETLLIYRQYGYVSFTWKQFHKTCSNHHTVKCIGTTPFDLLPHSPEANVLKHRSCLNFLLLHCVQFDLISYRPVTELGRIPVLTPDSKVHWANMGPTWVLLAPDGPHVGPMNLATRNVSHK